MWKPVVSAVVLGFLAVGCAHERHDEIPPSAVMVAEGDKTLSYTAPSSGRVYVFDTVDNRMVYAGDVVRGQAVSLDLETNKLTIDGRTVSEKSLQNGHRHRIFFDTRM